MSIAEAHTCAREGAGSEMRVSETCMFAILIETVDRDSQDKLLW